MSDPNSNGLASCQPKPPDERLYQQFNGIHSSQSSRSSSPMVKPSQVPLTPLPVNRPIPQSQLPPSRSPLTTSIHQSGGFDSLNTGSLKLSMNTSNMQGLQSVTPTSGVITTSAFPNQSLQLEPSSAKNYVSSVVPNSKPSTQKLPQNLSSNTIGNSNTAHFPESSTNQNTNKNELYHLNSQLNPAPTLPSSYFGEQIADPQSQFRPNYPQNYKDQMAAPAQQRPYLSQETKQLQNFQRIPLQTSQPTHTGFNQGTPRFPQANIGSNMSNYQTRPQISSPPFNSQFTKVQSNLSNLNISNSNFPSTTMPNNTGTSISNRNTQPLQQNIFTSQNKQPILPPPSIFQQNPDNIQSNYSGLPSGTTSINQKPNVFSNRYPTSANSITTTQQQKQFPQHQQISTQPQYQNNSQESYSGSGIVHSGFNKFWGTENVDLLQTPQILPSVKQEAPRIVLGTEILDQANCTSDVFRCTVTRIPENNSLLQKSRLPLGVLIHPFRDLNHLPVIQCNVIVRCRACRTYINPFVLFVDSKRWKCNLCYRINELPEEFQYDPVTKTYGDPSRRPEIKSSTLEYIAPAEYMLRPPQPAVYLFLLDVSQLAVESGYLQIVSKMLLEELKNLPGDARTQIGFVGYDSAIHFYSLPEGTSQPHEMTVLDVDDVFLPTPDNLLVNLKDRIELVMDLLTQLPTKYVNTFDTNSALGAALQVAYKMINATGGRVTVFQASLPNIGPGALTSREDLSQRASIEVAHLNPANDFYKRLALECSGQQIAVDLFLINSQYIDIATISGISRYSGGCIHHFPLLKPTKPVLCESFSKCFRRYLTRKIGFEAVMRIRCTRGLAIHTFHGNFFVRSTDLLSLPNINPDAGFGMQLAIEESLADVQTVCFQAALLYTSSKGERRIRVHTICLPVASTLHDIIHSADQQCIIGLLSKMAVDRSMQSSLSDAREAFINVAIDILSSYKMSLNLGSPVSGLLAPNSLSLLPLYISAMLKHRAFRVGSSTRLDDRVMAMIDMKTKPLGLLMQQVYPDLYPIHELEKQQIILNSEEESVCLPPKLQLSARCLENKGAFLMDLGDHMIILVCPNISLEFLNEALGVSHYSALPEEMIEIPILDNIRNQRLHQFIQYLNEDKPFIPTVQIIRDNSINRTVFFERLIEDRVENALSYHEFLQHLKTQVK